MKIYWNSGTKKISSEEDCSSSHHAMSKSENTQEMSKYLGQITFRQQQSNDFFGESLMTAECGHCDNTVLDSSFTQDPTPVLMPLNTMSQETKAPGRAQTFMKQPALKIMTPERYFVTYLGNEKGKDISESANYKTSSCPSYSMASPTQRITSIRSSCASNSQATSALYGLSGQSSIKGQSSEPFYHSSVGTWPKKRSGNHVGCISEDQENFVDDLLSGNCTSLPCPLISMLQGAGDDDSSTSEDSPITPRRPAPPPPKRKSSENVVRSSTLPGRRSNDTAKEHFKWDSLPSKATGHERANSGREDAKPTQSSPHASPKGSPKIGAAGGVTLKPKSKSQSVPLKDRNSYATVEKVHVIHLENNHKLV